MAHEHTVKLHGAFLGWCRQSLALWLLVVTAQLSLVAHMGLVRHERCLEHGELVERSGAAPAHVAQASSDEVTAFASLDDDAHEHCPLTVNPVTAPGTPSVLAFQQVARALETPSTPHDVVTVAVDVLRIAPKQGPPQSHV